MKRLLEQKMLHSILIPYSSNKSMTRANVNVSCWSRGGRMEEKGCGLTNRSHEKGRKHDKTRALRVALRVDVLKSPVQRL